MELACNEIAFSCNKSRRPILYRGGRHRRSASTLAQDGRTSGEDITFQSIYFLRYGSGSEGCFFNLPRACFGAGAVETARGGGDGQGLLPKVISVILSSFPLGRVRSCTGGQLNSRTAFPGKGMGRFYVCVCVPFSSLMFLLFASPVVGNDRPNTRESWFSERLCTRTVRLCTR